MINFTPENTSIPHLANWILQGRSLMFYDLDDRRA